MSVPKDKYNLVHILFILHGLGILMPWNSTMKVFLNFLKRRLIYNDQYFIYMILVITTIGLRIIFHMINMFVPKSYGSLSSRILISIGIQAFVMAFTVFLIFADTERLSDTVLIWITIVFNVLMSVGSALYMSSAFGSAADKPMKYTNAVCLGMILEIIMGALSGIISYSIGVDSKTMAILYFLLSIIIQIFCIALEIGLNSKKFRVYYRELTENKANPYSDRNEGMDIKGNRYLYVLRQISEQMLDLFLTFFVWFAIFPVMIQIKSYYWFSDRILGHGFTFLYFEGFIFIGIITANCFHYPTPKSMIAFTSARLLLIPIYLFFDYQPRGIKRSLPVLLRSDLLYMTLNAIHGITSGHFWALSLMYAPKQVRPQYSYIAGMMSSFIIFIGVLFGVYFSAILSKIV